MFSMKRRDWCYFLKSIVCCVFVSQNAMALFRWTAIVAAGQCAFPGLINWNFAASVLGCFLQLWKNLEGDVHLAQRFTSVCALVRCSIFSGPVMKQSIMAGSAWCRKAVQLWQPEGGQRKRQPAYKGLDKRYPSGTWPQGPSRSRLL